MAAILGTMAIQWLMSRIWPSDLEAYREKQEALKAFLVIVAADCGDAEMIPAPLIHGSGDAGEFRVRISLHAEINLSEHK
jgi:hypothetical protein